MPRISASGKLDCNVPTFGMPCAPLHQEHDEVKHCIYSNVCAEVGNIGLHDLHRLSPLTLPGGQAVLDLPNPSR